MRTEEITNREIRSANLHIFGKCNYQCEHCFDRCLTPNYMRPKDWRGHLDYLKSIGIEKINLAGGEPTLYPFLEEMVDLLNSYGFKISIVSNGSCIDEDFLIRYQGRISWIGLSIDSPDEEDEVLVGRHRKGLKHIEHIISVSELAHRYGYKVKLNITVIRRSWNKDFRPLLSTIGAERVKVFRPLTLKGANDDIPDTWSITDEHFEHFRKAHQNVEHIVFEDNVDMVSSYLMFDPMGRWMVDSGYEKRFKEFGAILREGLDSEVDKERYYARNAVYDW